MAVHEQNQSVEEISVLNEEDFLGEITPKKLEKLEDLMKQLQLIANNLQTAIENESSTSEE